MLRRLTIDIVYPTRRHLPAKPEWRGLVRRTQSMPCLLSRGGVARVVGEVAAGSPA